MKEKQCSCCKELKPLCDYQKRAASPDGLTHSCKSCLQARDRARYPKERERRAELMKRYMQTPEGKRSHSISANKWRELNSVRKAAIIILNNALRNGKVQRQLCFVCGAKAHGHHPDYDRPLDVIWLCPKHHKEAHQNV